MWPFSNKKNAIPDFGFGIALVQRLDNGNTVYAGYGIRVVEMLTEEGRKVYQLRVKDKLLMDWGLLGTFRRTSEIRNKLADLSREREQKHFSY